MTDEMSDSDRLRAIHNELKTIRQLVSKAVNAMVEAESEVPEKIRQEMAADPNNRWDHTRLLAKPKEN